MPYLCPVFGFRFLNRHQHMDELVDLKEVLPRAELNQVTAFVWEGANSDPELFFGFQPATNPPAGTVVETFEAIPIDAVLNTDPRRNGQHATLVASTLREFDVWLQHSAPLFAKDKSLWSEANLWLCPDS